LKTVRSNIQSTLTEIEIINEKISVGRVTKYESYAFTARLNSHKVELVTLQTDSLAALGELRQLMNIPYDQQLELATIDTAVIASLSATNISAKDYVESLLKSHPAIKQAQMDEQAAEIGVKIVKSSSWPSISVGGNVSSNYNRNQVNNNGDKVSLSNQLNDNLGQYVNLGLRVPIFSQMQTTNRIKKERINVENSRLAKTEAINTISRTAIQSINDFNSAKEKYHASKLAWEQNNLSYDMYKEKYRLGQVSSVELIAISDILNTSSMKFLQTELELFLRYQLLQLLQSYSQ
jgi:outer membrane protein